ncbi:MAG: hypothetical protein HRU20_27325 [Pseudomonadales bacterium]|nr:hypothetical protein [Pseudomonadales bacterium]
MPSDHEQLIKLLSLHSINPRFVDFLDKNKKCIIKNQLDYSEAKQLEKQFIDLDIIVRLRLQFDADCWFNGIKNTKQLTGSSIGESVQCISSDACRSDSCEEEITEYTFPAYSINPKLFLPERCIPAENNHTMQLIFHKTTLSYNVAILIAIIYAYTLCTNLYPLIQSMNWFSTSMLQLINPSLFITFLTLFSMLIYQSKSIEIKSATNTTYLSEKSSIWKQGALFQVLSEDNIETIEYIRKSDSLIYKNEHGDQLFTYRRSVPPNEGASSTLSDATSTILSHWIFEALFSLKQVFDSIRGVRKNRINFHADILDHEHNHVATLSIGKQLNLQINSPASDKKYQEKILAFALALQHNVYG